MGESASPVRSVPPNELATGQVIVAATNTLIVAARPGRRGVLIISDSTIPLYLGNSTMTTGDGLKLVGIAGIGITIPTALAIYGIAASGSVAVSYMELY